MRRDMSLFMPFLPQIPEPRPADQQSRTLPCFVGLESLPRPSGWPSVTSPIWLISSVSSPCPHAFFHPVPPSEPWPWDLGSLSLCLSLGGGQLKGLAKHLSLLCLLEWT